MLTGNPMFAFLAAWILAVAAIFCCVIARPVPSPKRFPILIVIAIAAVARLVPLFVFRHPTGLYTNDINNYRIVAEAILRRHDAYVPTGAVFIHPYLPLQMYVLALADWAAGRLPATFFTLVRLPQVCADIGIAVLLYKASLQLTSDTRLAFRNALAYAICPFPILVGVYHGQFDSISVFFALFSWLLVISRPGPRLVAIAGCLLGLGILEKTWPAFIFPILFLCIDNWRSRLIYAVSAIATPVVAVAVYLPVFSGSLSLLVERTTRYRGPPYIDGHPLILHQLSRTFPRLDAAAVWDVNHGLWVLLLGAGMALVLELPRRDPLGGVIAVTAAVLAATTNGGNYHYLWLFPFAILSGRRLVFALLVAAATVRFMIVGFVGGGVYFGALLYPGLQTFVDHGWIVGAIEWGLVLFLFLSSLYRAFPRRLSDLLTGYRRALFLKG